LSVDRPTANIRFLALIEILARSIRSTRRAATTSETASRFYWFVRSATLNNSRFYILHGYPPSAISHEQFPRQSTQVYSGGGLTLNIAPPRWEFLYIAKGQGGKNQIAQRIQKMLIIGGNPKGEKSANILPIF
jgi:hypothetical protein